MKKALMIVTSVLTGGILSTSVALDVQPVSSVTNNDVELVKPPVGDTPPEDSIETPVKPPVGDIPPEDSTETPVYQHPTANIGGKVFEVENLESSRPSGLNTDKLADQARSITVRTEYNSTDKTLTITVDGKNGKSIKNLEKAFYLTSGSVPEAKYFGSTFSHDSIVIHNPDATVFNQKIIVVWLTLVQDSGYQYSKTSTKSTPINIK